MQKAAQNSSSTINNQAEQGTTNLFFFRFGMFNEKIWQQTERMIGKLHLSLSH